MTQYGPSAGSDEALLVVSGGISLASEATSVSTDLRWEAKGFCPDQITLQTNQSVSQSTGDWHTSSCPCKLTDAAVSWCLEKSNVM